jgi:hypothetical protein
MSASDHAISDVIECVDCGTLSCPATEIPPQDRPYLAEDSSLPSAKAVGTTAREHNPDVQLQVLAMMLPIIGFIAGLLRLVTGNHEGALRVFAWAIAGVVLWSSCAGLGLLTR